MAKPNVEKWSESESKLVKLFEFADFTEAMTFMVRVSYECEKLDHHPDWRHAYNRLWVSLNTHSAGDTVTEKDRRLARIMDEIFLNFVV